MFCGNCGTKLEPNTAFCPNCGCKVKKMDQPYNIPDTTSKPKTKQKSPSTSFKFFLVVALACFFFPFVTVSCAGEDVTASGVELMTTTSFQEEYDFSQFSKNPYLFLTVFLAIAGITTSRKDKSLKFPGTASAGATISLLVFRFKFYSFYEIAEMKEHITVDFRWGWWLSLLFLVASTGTAIMSFLNRQDTQNVLVQNRIKTDTESSPPEVENSIESESIHSDLPTDDH